MQVMKSSHKDCCGAAQAAQADWEEEETREAPTFTEKAKALGRAELQ
jgi:hypothetical protein